MRKIPSLLYFVVGGVILSLLIWFLVGPPPPPPIPTSAQLGLNVLPFAKPAEILKEAELRLVLDTSRPMVGYFRSGGNLEAMKEFWNGLDSLSREFKQWEGVDLRGAKLFRLERDFQGALHGEDHLGLFSESTSPIEEAMAQGIAWTKNKQPEGPGKVLILVTDAQISYHGEKRELDKSKTASQIGTATRLSQWISEGCGFSLLSLRTSWQGTYESEKPKVGERIPFPSPTDRLLHCFILGSDPRLVARVGQVFQARLNAQASRVAYLEASHDASAQIEVRLTGSIQERNGKHIGRPFDNMFNLKFLNRIVPSPALPATVFQLKTKGRGRELISFRVQRPYSSPMENPWVFLPKSLGKTGETKSRWFQAQVEVLTPGVKPEWKVCQSEDEDLTYRSIQVKKNQEGQDELELDLDASIHPLTKRGDKTKLYRVRLGWNPAQMSDDSGPLAWIGSWSTDNDSDRGRLTKGNRIRTLDLDLLLGDALKLKDPLASFIPFSTFYIQIKH